MTRRFVFSRTLLASFSMILAAAGWSAGDEVASPSSAAGGHVSSVIGIGVGSQPALSGDGRFAAFVGSDGIIRVYDRTTGASTSEGRGSSPALSFDGRFVAFNLFDVSPAQVYVRDRLIGLTALASASNSGLAGNANSFLSGISAEGKLVAFVSDATNLVPGATGHNAFTRDWQLGVTTRENLDANGQPVNVASNDAFPVALSANGRFVAFSSAARVLIRDRTTGSVEAETFAGDFLSSSNPSLSDDGRFLSFTIVFKQLAPRSIATYVRDRVTGTVLRLPDNGLGRVSGDGSFVSYIREPADAFPATFAAVWEPSSGRTFDLGESLTFNSAISRIAAGAVAYSIDNVVYVAVRDQRPPAPTNLIASVAGSVVTLAWQAPAGAAVTSYLLEAGSAPGASDLASLATNNPSTTFTAAGVGAGTYYVRVRAVGAAGTGPSSNEVLVVVTTGCAPSTPPGNLQASVTGSTVALSWSGAAGATTYVLEVGSTPGQSDILVVDLRSAATTLTATNVAPRSYFVRLRAANACGASGASNEAVVVVR